MEKTLQSPLCGVLLPMTHNKINLNCCGPSHLKEALGFASAERMWDFYLTKEWFKNIGIDYETEIRYKKLFPRYLAKNILRQLIIEKALPAQDYPEISINGFIVIDLDKFPPAFIFRWINQMEKILFLVQIQERDCLDRFIDHVKNQVFRLN